MSMINNFTKVFDKSLFSVYNKLKPDDPDKVVDIESQDEQVGYEFSTTQVRKC